MLTSVGIDRHHAILKYSCCCLCDGVLVFWSSVWAFALFVYSFSIFVLGVGAGACLWPVCLSFLPYAFADHADGTAEASQLFNVRSKPHCMPYNVVCALLRPPCGHLQSWTVTQGHRWHP